MTLEFASLLYSQLSWLSIIFVFATSFCGEIQIFTYILYRSCAFFLCINRMFTNEKCRQCFVDDNYRSGKSKDVFKSKL